MYISTKIKQIIDGVIVTEGGYVNNPDDPGGATRFGITKETARLYGYEGDMASLPRSVAFQIYYDEYVKHPNFDDVVRVNKDIGEELIDTGVNCGVDVPSEFLQRCLNIFNRQERVYRDIVVDGAIGTRTLTALNEYLSYRGKEGVAVILKALDCLQGERYISLAEGNERFETFAYGWIRTRIGNVD